MIDAPEPTQPVDHLPYLKRAALCPHAKSARLLQLMARKQSNLAVAVDARHQADVLALADALGPQICVLKTHIDLIDDFTPDFVPKLQALAAQHQFFLFEDRKFADIGQTVAHQYAGGVYKISHWADFITVHALIGPSILAGIKTIDPDAGVLLLAEMSARDNWLDANYAERTLALAQAHPQLVAGLIAQTRPSSAGALLQFSPGIHLSQSGDGLGQQYRTAEQAIVEQGTDVMIVGRGITQAEQPVAAAARYRTAGWSAYLTNITTQI